MKISDKLSAAQGSLLCKSCGLCCTGHLFVWVKLKSAEKAPAQNLGLNVIHSDPRQRGFTQPCPLWQGQCTIYTSPHYPKSCRTYQCKQLKGILNENASMDDSLSIIQQAKDMISEVDVLLPSSGIINFRERLVESVEQGILDVESQLKSNDLLVFLETHFGVKDFFD